MSEIKQDLSIRGESIQRVYSFLEESNLIVNRQYQRKLVWNIEEKKSFIDSVVMGYPVPLFLFAEINYEKRNVLEVIDGLQRLNAILSFIEQEFCIESAGFFDLETIPETKLKLDNKQLTQKEPRLDRKKCVDFSNYLLPFSIYKKGKSEEIDEIFRRINSGGRQLSRQDIRQSGSLGNFSEIVRKISSKVRGDDSSTNMIPLGKMKHISISNISLDYGINVNDVFWVKQSILPREKVRESRDEEVIADVLGYILLKETPYSNKKMLDSYYGLYKSEANKKRFKELENKINKDSQEFIIDQFIYVYNELREILDKTTKQFNRLLFPNAKSKSHLPRYFQSIFLALFYLLVEKKMKVKDYDMLVKIIEDMGKDINVGTGAGGVWTSGDRDKSVSSVVGMIEKAFIARDENDPALYSWTTEFENILMQSTAEQDVFDFKQGLLDLSKGQFSEKTFGNYIKTCTAIANIDCNATGYLIIGVADSESDSKKIMRKYKIDRVEYNRFFVTGVEHEAVLLNKSMDDYYNFIISKIEKQPISDEFKNLLERSVSLINYFGKTVVVIKITSLNDPVIYDQSYYERKGNRTVKVATQEFPVLFKRFHNT